MPMSDSKTKTTLKLLKDWFEWVEMQDIPQHAKHLKIELDEEKIANILRSVYPVELPQESDEEDLKNFCNKLAQALKSKQDEIIKTKE
jgi:hypothetical protein